MAITFAIILVLHGLIHFMGFAKAFKYADLSQLTVPISPLFGALWLLSALLFLATAAALFLWPRWWWALGFTAFALSTVAIVPSWTDAKFGALANVVVLAGVVVGLFWHGPLSLRSQYEEDVKAGLARAVAWRPVTGADLAPLPELIQRYLRRAGVVGQPRVRQVRAAMHGRIRSAANAPWMPLSAEQHNFYDQPSRFFYMTASRSGVPFQGYHRYSGPAATMRVKVVGLVPVVDQAGAEMTRAETVTLFNDMCLLAPATLIDPSIRWEPLDKTTVRGTFTNAGHTIRADLTFDAAGDLVDFRSDDRGRASSDGTGMEGARWSTPVEGYRTFGAFRLMSRGQARWQDATGSFAYIELEITDVAYNEPSR